MGNISKLARYTKGYRVSTAVTLVFIMGEVALEVVIPRITSNLVDVIQEGADISLVVKFGVAMVLFAVLSLMCGSVAGIACSRASAGFAKNLRQAMFRRVQDFSFGNIDKFSTSSLVTRMTTDVTNVQNSYMMVIRTAIRAPLMLVLTIISAFTMGGKLAVTFVIVIPVLVVGFLLIGKFALPAFRAVFKKYDKLNEAVEEDVRGIRVVKGFAREEFEKAKFNAASDDIRKDFTTAERIVGLNMPIMQLCIYFNSVFLLWVGSKTIISTYGESVNIGQVSALLTYGMMILMSLMMLSLIYIMLTMSVESVKRIVEVLDEVPGIQNPEEPVMEIPDGSIDFENVSFSYSSDANRNALTGIDLHISSGMTVGILGGTGSGKTSLIQLIPRLYDVSEGAVKVGGIDVRNYDITALRDAVSVVLQKNVLFSGTIKENLMWGNKEATDEEIHNAARLAQAEEFILSFPDGYDSRIEQGGTNVSGGQKQRLCIARALLKNPKILILDDSTSAVDTRTDSLIRKGFREYIPETTKIIIAQRIASVQDADLIVILDNGRIVDSGTHDELMKTSEIYQEIYEQQVKGGDDDE
ncbi:ATP-binding cassette, subfamily B [Ruminococcaceae bacterium YRB3002]|nr:ATP-binding cassette, subfamily B [Ruminococcaceae bacterium YRB3002]